MSPELMVLVEPDADDAALARAAFAGTNLADRVVIVDSVVAALERIQAQGGPAVIVIALDATRPDAFAPLALLKTERRLQVLPVVVLADADATLVAAAYAAGASSFVTKPADRGDLITVLQQVGTYWLRLNRPPPCT